MRRPLQHAPAHLVERGGRDLERQLAQAVIEAAAGVAAAWDLAAGKQRDGRVGGRRVGDARVVLHQQPRQRQRLLGCRAAQRGLHAAQRGADLVGAARRGRRVYLHQNHHLGRQRAGRLRLRDLASACEAGESGAESKST